MKGFEMENIKDMKELLKTMQEMSKAKPSKKKSSGSILVGFVASLFVLWLFFAWATFSVVSVLYLMNLI
jgi:hypothetical protein